MVRENVSKKQVVSVLCLPSLLVTYNMNVTAGAPSCIRKTRVPSVAGGAESWKQLGSLPIPVWGQLHLDFGMRDK